VAIVITGNTHYAGTFFGDTMTTVAGTIMATLAAEFTDLPDVAGVTRLAIRLLIAAALGGVLGYERERLGTSAGLRTHMLVAVGATLFVFVPQQAGFVVADMSRVLQGLISGIGFLGAGAILKLSDKQEIRGLTTAAGLWLTAAIGVSVGLGHDATAVVSTVFAVIILAVLGRFKRAA
jgi:putative Mg2+ transporter-C (MgtC) family protein